MRIEKYPIIVSVLDRDTRRPTHQPHATPMVNDTDSSVGVVGWRDTQSNAGLRIIGSRGHSHVILIWFHPLVVKLAS